jgi:hypothetical protein
MAETRFAAAAALVACIQVFWTCRVLLQSFTPHSKLIISHCLSKALESLLQYGF